MQKKIQPANGTFTSNTIRIDPRVHQAVQATTQVSNKQLNSKVLQQSAFTTMQQKRHSCQPQKPYSIVSLRPHTQSMSKNLPRFVKHSNLSILNNGEPQWMRNTNLWQKWKHGHLQHCHQTTSQSLANGRTSLSVTGGINYSLQTTPSHSRFLTDPRTR